MGKGAGMSGRALVVYGALDVLCVGMGMGVPICCILLGFPVGWYVARSALGAGEALGRGLARVMRAAVTTSLFTFALMAVLWGRTIVLLFDPAADLAHFGIPQILYTPEASFLGWLGLMIFLSPFFQLLATIFAGQVVLLRAADAKGE
jgi:predicted DNA repair protein MutK